MDFMKFETEVIQSIWEQKVKFNLTESGVHPVPLKELIGDNNELLEKILATEINYPMVNGTLDLRRKISALYDNAKPENVLVTVGAAEANMLIANTLMEKGDELATVNPTYKQVWGICQNNGHVVRPFRLDPDQGWALDLDDMKKQINKKTKIIAVVNPNNPTGHIFTENEMNAIIQAADSVGAWILADEVYRGAEHEQDAETPSFYGRHDKVLAVGSMSKAYGLPGLRVGWIVAPEKTIEDLWRRHEYSTITTGIFGNQLAAHALTPSVRKRLILRARNYIRKGFPVLEDWLLPQKDLFSFTRPQASAVCFIKYNLDVNSTELMDRLCRQVSVFVGSGDSFGMDGHIRVAFGQDKHVLEEAFNRITTVIDQYK